MNEKEIKEIIKDFLELREIHSSDSARKSYLSIYQEAIQGLLDLYNKAQAKLTEYEKQLDLEYVEENYIPRAFVEEKFKELKKVVTDYPETDEEIGERAQLKILQEILNKGE